jgi:membrane dipeptidase
MVTISVMVRIFRYAAAALLCLSLTACFEGGDKSKSSPGNPDGAALVPSPAAFALHGKTLTIDSHVDIPKNFATPEADPGLNGKMQVDLPKMKAGGLDAVFFSVFVGQTPRTPENELLAEQKAMVKFEAIHRMCEVMYPDRIALATSAGEVEKIHREGRLAALIGIENGYVIGHDLSLLKKYYDLGARYMTLAHKGHNDIADSANPAPELGDKPAEHHGLSDFGRQVVAEMNRLGMMVDVSHISKEAMMQATSLSRAPVIASHSATRALADLPRNLDDEQLRAIRDKGGVVQVVAYSLYVKKQPEKEQALADMKAATLRKYSRTSLDDLSDEQIRGYNGAVAELDKIWPRATLSDFVDHIDHAVKIIGVDHVGISSDFGGGGGVSGWENASQSANVTAELLRRGYNGDQIAALWGGNLLRVMRETEQIAADMQKEPGKTVALK